MIILLKRRFKEKVYYKSELIYSIIPMQQMSNTQFSTFLTVEILFI